jgi:hypothetical protein
VLCLRPAKLSERVPPLITYSVPVMEAALGETRNATRSDTSFSFAVRPIQDANVVAEAALDRKPPHCAWVSPGLTRNELVKPCHA